MRANFSLNGDFAVNISNLRQSVPQCAKLTRCRCKKYARLFAFFKDNVIVDNSFNKKRMQQRKNAAQRKNHLPGLRRTEHG